jgi:Fe-S cluster assembly protein SufB
MINQLHAAVVELIALENATIKYSTVQNGIQEMNLEKEEYIICNKTDCVQDQIPKYHGLKLKGSAITWKYQVVYLSIILKVSFIQ